MSTGQDYHYRGILPPMPGHRSGGGSGFRCRRLLALLIPWLVFALEDAQAQPSTGRTNISARVLTNAAQVLELSREEADRSYRVLIPRACVTIYDQTANLFFIQDGTAGIYAYHAAALDHHPGQVVELSGFARSGKFSPIILVEKSRVVGQTNLPPPRLVSADAILSGSQDSQWVEVEGIVHRHSKDWGTLGLELNAGGRDLLVRVLAPRDAEVVNFLDARIRVRGVVGTLFGKQDEIEGFMVNVAHMTNVTVLDPPRDDLFTAPLRSGRSLAGYSAPNLQGHATRVRGVVSYERPNRWVFIRDETSPLRLQSRTNNEFKPGDVIEAVGFPTRGTAAAYLQECLFRKIGETNPPAALPVSVSPNLGALHDGQLVEVEGRLLETAAVATNRFLMFLQASGIVFQASFQYPSIPVRVSRLERGSVLKLRGICVSRVGEDLGRENFLLRVRQPSDITLLQAPNWWTANRWAWAVGALTICLVTAGAWVSLVKRQVRLQTGAIRERERALEERFHDLYENANDIIYSHDLLGNITSVNRAGESILGYPHEEAVKLNVSQLVSPSDWQVLRAQMDKKLRGESRTLYELEVTAKDGRRVVLEINSRLEYREGKPAGITGIAHDITERKLTEERLRQSEQQSRHALEVRERLARDLHDGLIQSVYAVGLALENCRCLIRENPREAEEKLQTSLASLNLIMRDIRAFIIGLDPASAQSRDLRPALEALVQAMNVSPVNQLVLQVDPAACACVSPQESGHLIQIAREAISNSLRHAHASSTVIKVERREGVVRFEVSDDGVGFATDTIHDAGFGLRNMEYRAKEMGAQLQVVSKPHEGTRIFLEFRARPQAGPALAAAPRAGIAGG